MGKSNPFSFRRSSSSTTRRRRTTKKVGGDVAATGKPLAAKPKKKGGGARLWMRFDRSGGESSELFECDKNTIIKRAGIPARDLRILGPVFSNSSNILGN